MNGSYFFTNCVILLFIGKRDNFKQNKRKNLYTNTRDYALSKLTNKHLKELAFYLIPCIRRIKRHNNWSYNKRMYAKNNSYKYADIVNVCNLRKKKE